MSMAIVNTVVVLVGAVPEGGLFHCVLLACKCTIVRPLIQWCVNDWVSFKCTVWLCVCVCLYRENDGWMHPHYVRGYWANQPRPSGSPSTVPLPPLLFFPLLSCLPVLYCPPRSPPLFSPPNVTVCVSGVRDTGCVLLCKEENPCVAVTAAPVPWAKPRTLTQSFCHLDQTTVELRVKSLGPEDQTVTHCVDDFKLLSLQLIYSNRNSDAVLSVSLWLVLRGIRINTVRKPNNK